MSKNTEVKIPSGRYSISGTMKVYTHVEVDEGGTVKVIKDVMDVGSHQFDSPADVWNSEDATVSEEIATLLVEKLESNPNAWDSSDGMRWD